MVKKGINKNPKSLINEYYCKSVEQDCLRVNFSSINLIFKIAINADDNTDADADQDLDYIVLSYEDAATLASDIQEYLLKNLLTKE